MAALRCTAAAMMVTGAALLASAASMDTARAEETEREIASLRREIEARDRQIKAQNREMAGMKKHQKKAKTTELQEVDYDFVQALQAKGIQARDLMQGVEDYMDAHPDEDPLLGRRRLQQGDPGCHNFGEEGYGPYFFGVKVCGHFTSNAEWGSINSGCTGFMCESDVNGTNLCFLSEMCNAFCGFCARPPQGELALGQNMSVQVNATDSPNNPNYHSLTATAGQTYRVRAFPDLEAVPRVRSMLLIVRNPAGKPIRRAVSNTGNMIDLSSTWAPETPAQLEAHARDATLGCAGASHLDIVFKATMDGVYSIGLSQATDTGSSLGNPSIRTEDTTVHDFTLQWRGVLHPYMDPNYDFLDFGQVGSLARFGAPASGTLKLLVDDITDTLPPLPDSEQVAMEELKSAEHGVGVPDYVWDPNAHPCTWGGDVSGLSPGCCLSGDPAGNLLTASITSINTGLWGFLHEGARDTAEFGGTIPDSIGSLSSLRSLFVGPSQISGTIPASVATLPLHTLIFDNTQQWGELPEVSSTVETFVARSLAYVSGTVPASLGAVESLKIMYMTGTGRVSGTLPSLCGHQSLLLICLRNTPMISGTIHDLPHPDHPSHAYNNDRCIMSQGIGNYVAAHNRLSGTISEKFACSRNGKTSFNGNVLTAIWNTGLSGTLPPCFFDGLTREGVTYFPYNRFSGQIPNMNLSTLMYGMRFEGNDFQKFPDAFPNSLRMFKANNNPRMLATGAEVARMLQTAPYLNDFSVTVDNTIAASIARAGGAIGTLPHLGFTEVHPTLPLDCRFGEKCGFVLELVLHFDYVPLRSMGIDFVVHMSASPADLNDQLIDIGYLISNSSQQGRGAGTYDGAFDYDGRRRRAQQRATEEDAAGHADEFPAEVQGETGNVANHVESLNLTRTILMDDTDDGMVRVQFPAEWFRRTGRYNFRIFGTTNYCQANVSGVMDTLPPGSCATDSRCDCSHHEEQLIELHDKSLWFVNMHPIVCHDSLATPNAAGTHCQCPPGTAPTKPCEKGDSFCECIPCATYGSTHYSDDGVECKQCNLREVSNTDATGCQCGNQFYNSSNGLITCHNQNVKDGIFETDDAYQVARAQLYSAVCIECPACIDCTVVNSPPRIRAGFHMSDADATSTLWFQEGGGTSLEKNVIRCRPESLEDEAILDERLDALSRVRPNGTLTAAMSWSPSNDLAEYPDEEVQCLGTPYMNGRFVSTNPGSLMCAYGHSGTACGKCREGFGKKNENQCVECGAALKLESILTTLSFITVVALVVSVLLMVLSYCVGDVHGEHLGKFGGHASDLDADLSSMLLTQQTAPHAFEHGNPLHSEEESLDKQIDIRLRELFQRFDDNDSGLADRYEVAAMARSVGQNMTKVQLDTAMQLMDTSGDGLVSFEEFAAWIKSRTAENGGGLFPVVQMSMLTIFKTGQGLFLSVGSMSVQPIKLFISYWQIAAQLGPVLHFSFPPQMAALIKVFKPFVAAIHGFVALECAGLTGGFYVAWVFEVFVVPATLWSCVGVYYLVRRRTVGIKQAVAKSTDNALFVLFCVYPMMSNKFFKMLNCRDLGNGQRVVSTDYSVDCNDAQHRFYELIAIVMIAGFSFGVPLGLMLIMARVQRQRHKEHDTSEWNYISRRIATQLGEDDASAVKETFIDISLGNVYGTLVNAYRPGYFRWECFDMIRKLLLVGMLTIVQQGSVLQICAGLATSFVFFASHIRALPFRHMEDNVLKATTEAHLFIILILVLALKSGLENDVVDESFYDRICTVLFVIFVVLATILCISHKWKVVVSHTIEAANDQTYTQCLQTAFQRHRLGRDKIEDRTLLSEYLAKIEDEIMTDYHVFISYRVATEAAFAKKLYEELSQMTLAETGQKLRVYLDQVRLEDGERWDSGFMQGLASSWIVVPIVSAGSLTPMGDLFDKDGKPAGHCDNVLLEWTAALELFSRHEVKAVMPIIACSEDGSSFSWGLSKDLSNDQHEPTLTATKKHLRGHPSTEYLPASSTLLTGVTEMVADVTDGSDGRDGHISVSGIVAAVLRFQGILITDRNDLSTCRERIFKKVTDLLNTGGHKEEPDAKGVAEGLLEEE